MSFSKPEIAAPLFSILLTLLSGSLPVQAEQYLYDYDAAGRLTSITYPDGSSMEYLYDASGGLLQVVEGPAGIADLELLLEASPNPVNIDPEQLDYNLTYSFTITNPGPDTAMSVILEHTPPAELTITSVNESAGTCTIAATIHCELGDLETGTSTLVTLLASGQDVATYSLSGTAGSQTTDFTPDNNQASLSVSVALTDSDEDGLIDSLEKSGPNNGDANGDGVEDYLQASVVSLPSTVTGNYLVVEAQGGCSAISASSSLRESELPQLDPEYVYPFGVTGFDLGCENPGDSAEVTLYFYDETFLGGYQYRYFGPLEPGGTDQSWYDLSGVTYSQSVIGGQTIATASYTLTDGQAGDATIVDSIIRDPGGPGIAQPTAIEETAFGSSTISFAAGDDDDITLSLGFEFPYFGRTITDISINTNGLVELLEDGESCTECADTQTHLDGDHVTLGLDTIFVANSDLITGMWIDKYSDHIVIYWAGKMFSNVDVYEFDEIAMRLELYGDGRILWKFYDMDYDANPGDLFTGLYDGVAGLEIAAPVQPTEFNDENIERAFEFSPANETISEIDWDDNNGHLAADDDDAFTYDLPFTFPYFDRQITSVDITTEGSVELLEDGENIKNDGSYARDFDAILSLFDDLITTVFVDIKHDRLEVTWIGFVDAGDDTFISDEVSMRVTLFQSGEILWQIGDAEYANQDYDLFTGLVDEVDGLEYSIPGGPEDINRENINAAFKWGLNNDRSLAGLSVSEGTLNPAFSSLIDRYQVDVPTETSRLSVTAVASDSGATIAVNSSPVDSGTSSPSIDLNLGNNIISIEVTAINGLTAIYQITVNRDQPLSDIDGDGIEDASDNCINDSNAEQKNNDLDSAGDVCDPDDDNDGIPDEFEIANGLDAFDATDAEGDLDRDGLTNIEEFNLGTDPRQDQVPPTLTIPEAKTVNATGQLTDVDPGTATAFDFRDGELVVTLDNPGPYTTGTHILTWRAEDAAGNKIEKTQLLHVVPLINFSPDQIAVEGSRVQISLSLNGAAVEYPVEIELDITGTASIVDDYETFEKNLIIQEGTSVELGLTIIEDKLPESDETIELSIKDIANAVVGTKSTISISIQDINIAPRANITLAQSGRRITTVYADAGSVSVTAEVIDPNPDDQHTFDWSGSDGEILDESDLNDASFEFNPAGIEPGLYHLDVQITDDGNPPASVVQGEVVRIAAAVPVLTDETDSDGDGISDREEGSGDSDGDRIPDYLDDNDMPNMLPTGEGDQILETNAGLKLRLGDAAFAAGEVTPRLEESDIPDPDVDFGYPNGVFDFDILDIPAGTSAQIIYSLSHRITGNAEYRKFIDGEWLSFISDSNNSVSTANTANTDCPEPGSLEYQDGLNRGDNCLQITISDGGPNDSDGEINGIISDPGGIALSVDVSFEPITTDNQTVTRNTSNIVMLHFRLATDSGDAILNSLTLQASGSGDDRQIDAVKLVLDENENGQVDSGDTMIGSGAFDADNGALQLQLTEPYTLPIGTSDYLVTYDISVEE